MRSTTLATLALLLATSCEDSCWMDDYSFVRQGQHVTVYGYDRSVAEACAGSFDALETHTASVMDFLGVDPANRYVYRWMSDDFYRAGEFCPSYASACTVHGEPRTRALPDRHEVVHMVTHSLPNGPCPSVIDEGLAVYFEAPHPREKFPSEDVGIRELLAAESIPNSWDAYARAGHFVSFLVESYGPDVIAKICATIPPSGGVASWDAWITRELDIDLDEFLAEYDAYPICGDQHFRNRLQECGGLTDHTVSPDNTTFTIETGCDDPRAMDVIWQGYASASRRLQVTQDATLKINVSASDRLAPGDVFVVSQECTPCSASPQVFSYDASEANHDIIYRTGGHYFTLVFRPDITIEATIEAVSFE